MSDLPTAQIVSLGSKRRFRVIDCEGERPFLVVRTKASTVLEGLRRAADEEMQACKDRMQAEAERHSKLCSHAKTAHYLRCLANRIEMEGNDAS